MTTMKALTLHPPWCYLVPDPKGVETRGWSTAYRGWLAIHASRKWDKGGLKFGKHPAVEHALQRILAETQWPELPNGAIVAVGRIAGVIPTEQFRCPTGLALWGDYSPGRYVWVLDAAKRLREPISCPGKQGLWDVAGAVVEQIRAQWKNGNGKG
jgi:hypothetical protein